MGDDNLTPGVDELLEELAEKFGNDEPRPDEFTIEEMHAKLVSKGVERSDETVRTWLNSMVDKGYLCRRTLKGKLYYRKNETTRIAND